MTATVEQIRKAVLDSLTDIAPNAEIDHLDGARPLRDQIELDSMDWLSVLVKIHDRLGVEVPERDYRRLASLDAMVSYLAERMTTAGMG